MQSAAVKCERDYSTLWSNTTPTTLEMAGWVRDFMNNFFWLFARQDRRKLSRSLRFDFPHSSIQTKNTSMQMMLVIWRGLQTQSSPRRCKIDRAVSGIGYLLHTWLHSWARSSLG